jgi:hypothetical protein
MATEHQKDNQLKPLDDAVLQNALTELGRTINIITTYGKNHPAVNHAAESCLASMDRLFDARKKVIVGAFNGMLSVDEVPVLANGTLLKSLERRLSRLRITGLKLSRGISHDELLQLADLLSSKEAEDFQTGMGRAGLSHISSADTRFEAVREGQSVANDSDLAGMGGGGVLVLEDDSGTGGGSGDMSGDASGSVHVEQIVAFLKGDVELDDEMGAELSDFPANRSATSFLGASAAPTTGCASNPPSRPRKAWLI